MVNFKLLISAVSLVCSSVAHAGYAQLAPPPNWTTSAGAAAYQAASNDVSFSGGIRGAGGVINVAGKSVSIPAAYRFAANAPRIAATFAYLNPALMLLGTAAAAYSFYQESGYRIVDGKWVKDGTQMEAKVDTQSFWSSDAATACSVYQTTLYKNDAYCTFSSSTATVNGVLMCQVIQDCKAPFNGNNGVFGMTSMSTRTVSGEPVSVGKIDFENEMGAKPLPYGVPQALPVPLPVEPVPILNPTPEPEPKPAILPVPVPQPMRVPQGEPVPVPNSDPQKWSTPVVDIVPANNPNAPWQVDLQPKDIVKDDPSKLPESEPVPVTPPAGQSETPKEPDLCEKYPDILACQKLDTPNSDTLETIEKPVSVTPDAGWGGGGSCPPARHITVQGRDIPIPFDLVCQYMSGIRPVVIAMAWLSAGFILLGARGGD